MPQLEVALYGQGEMILLIINGVGLQNNSTSKQIAALPTCTKSVDNILPIYLRYRPASRKSLDCTAWQLFGQSSCLDKFNILYQIGCDKWVINLNWVLNLQVHKKRISKTVWDSQHEGFENMFSKHCNHINMFQVNMSCSVII